MDLTSSDVNLVTALIDMFTKTGNIRLALRIFDGTGGKDVVVWNCMINKYAKTGLLEDYLWFPRQMKYEQVKPNSSTFAGLLSSCGAYEATYIGPSIRGFVEGEGLGMDAILGIALVDMYARLGFLDKGVDIFQEMETKDVKSWTTLILDYGARGLPREVISLFYKMQEEEYDIKPKEITFLFVLNACSHEGIGCFKRMIKKYRLMPKVEHYGHVINFLGQVGPHDLIMSLPIRSDSKARCALLDAYRVYRDVKLGERVKMELTEMGERHQTDSILLFRIHAIVGNLPNQ